MLFAVVVAYESYLFRVLERLQKSRKAAESANHLKDNFIATISHEIRTPLNVIIGNSELLIMIDDFDHETREGINESIHEATERLTRTVDLILSLSRFRSGDIKPNPEIIDVNAMLQHVMQLHKRHSTEKHIELRFSSDNERTTVYCDFFMIETVISNLIDNAVKYTNSGSVSIRLKHIRSQEIIQLTVEDTGIGMSPEFIDKACEPYHQESIGYTRSYEGVGLGLALTKAFLERLGIPMHIVSTKNVGTTVTLDIPQKLEDAALSVQSVSSQGTVNPPSTRSPQN